ncbi:hypothetical protein [Phaeocystidibacter luteus]|uniref:Porin family protein n=1 Tax=Phaeocystidibacter luteus TaxID=911197 RepID=A0A6N6RM52_9FLAO|nr:hypothetical protein [Phaeocystidibacter luteus]KAB2814633.1 hypothetical protein F8C67_02510 [Phaeocystidibacter luteus]
MKARYFTFALLLFGCMLNAQTYTRMSYPISWGAGANTGERINNTSWIGYHLEFGHDVHSNSFVGIETGWVTLYDEVNNVTETIGSTTVTGNQYRYLNVIPILLKYTYLFENSSEYVPFVAAAGGISWAKSTTDVGIFRFNNEEWPFTVGTEVGINFDMDYSTKFQLSGYYNFLAKRDNLNSQAYWGIRIGFMWM